MVNQSKVNDPRFWKKWRASGAVGGMPEANAKVWKLSKQEGGDVHYQELYGCGLRCAYLSRPEDVDGMVRKALGMEDTAIPFSDVSSISRDLTPLPHIAQYPERGMIVYRQPRSSSLERTSYEVEVSPERVIVGITSRVPADLETLKKHIQQSIIGEKFIPAGLVPIKSKRDQIPTLFLRNGP